MCITSAIKSLVIPCQKVTDLVALSSVLKGQFTPGRIFCHSLIIVFEVDNSRTILNLQPMARKIMKSVFLTRV